MPDVCIAVKARALSLISFWMLTYSASGSAWRQVAECNGAVMVVLLVGLPAQTMHPRPAVPTIPPFRHTDVGATIRGTSAGTVSSSVPNASGRLSNGRSRTQWQLPLQMIWEIRRSPTRQFPAAADSRRPVRPSGQQAAHSDGAGCRDPIPRATGLSTANLCRRAIGAAQRCAPRSAVRSPARLVFSRPRRKSPNRSQARLFLQFMDDRAQ
jgi:hypothetical protein